MKIGDVIKVSVVGFQPYGLFIKVVDDDTWSGLIHISEISYGFVKDITRVANLYDVIEAKILDIDNANKHLKLSIKAMYDRNRISRLRNANYYKQLDNSEINDFTPLSEKLNEWIEIESKGELKKNDKR